MYPVLRAPSCLEQLSPSDTSALVTQTRAHAVCSVRNHVACANAGTTAKRTSIRDERLQSYRFLSKFRFQRGGKAIEPSY